MVSGGFPGLFLFIDETIVNLQPHFTATASETPKNFIYNIVFHPIFSSEGQIKKNIKKLQFQLI